ncbi:MAG TPA: T9SS type A sorting domain-containing protein, partial [Bacteroidetes bacterium]|nr:T9SS type A sorting domain-containing protein [Bacteroidota bacterium]
DNDALQPTGFGLDDPVPNPFNSRVRIDYSLSRSGRMCLSLWDVNGRLVRELLRTSAGGGGHSLTLNAGLLPSGLYIIRLEAAGLSSQKKLILLR